MGIKAGCFCISFFKFSNSLIFLGFSKCDGDECACAEGFERQTGTCFPINNCHTDNGGCLDNAECIYTGPGVNMCVCPPGYQLNRDGVTCTECPESNCYRHCQFQHDVEAKRLMKQETRLKVRFLSVKTSDLHDYINERATEIVVITRQLIISGDLILPDGSNVTFFADEIIKKPGATIANRGRRADIRVVVEEQTGKLICEAPRGNVWTNRNQSLHIYLSNSSTPFVCFTNFGPPDFTIHDTILGKHNPRTRPLDDVFISMILDCAKVDAQQKTYARDNRLLRGSLPVRLIDHVFDEMKRARENGIDLPSSVQTLEMTAIDLMEDLTMRAHGIYNVPYLSLKAHEGILTLLKDDAKLAIDKYAKFEMTSQNFDMRIEATDSVTNVMTAMVRRNDVDIKALKTELSLAGKNAEKMKNRFDNANRELNKAKRTFEAGVRAFQRKMMVNTVLSIIGGVASVFSGGTSGILGISLELPDISSEVSKISRSVFKLSILMDVIAGVNEAMATFADVQLNVLPYVRSGASSYYSKNLPSQNGESLAVMIREWDIFVANAEAFLGMGDAANEISGTADYLAALKTVAVWGKGYHEKTIEVQRLMDDLLNKQSLQVAQYEAKRNIEEARDRALDANEMNWELRIQMSQEKQRLRTIMLNKLMSFCDSYYYNWLSDCPVMPTISDDLYALHGKINQGLSSVINAVENFAPFVPQAFEIPIVITDNDDCDSRYHNLITTKESAKKATTEENQPTVNGQRCPLSDLKLTKTFFHQVNVTDNKFFLSHDRAHVDEVEVYLKGATCEGCEDTDINLFISVTGMMKDIFRRKEYKFRSYSRVLEQSYQMQEGDDYKVTKAGKVSDEFEVFYDGVAALTTWIVSVPPEFNSESLDLQSVTEVRLKLKGTAVAQGHQSEATEDTRTVLVAKKGKTVNKMKAGLRAQVSQPEIGSFQRTDVETVMSHKLSRKSSPWQIVQSKGFGPYGPKKAAQKQTSVTHGFSKSTQNKKTTLHSAQKVAGSKTGIGPKEAFKDKNCGADGVGNAVYQKRFRQGLAFNGKAKGPVLDVKRKLSKGKRPRVMFQGKLPKKRLVAFHAMNVDEEKRFNSNTLNA